MQKLQARHAAEQIEDLRANGHYKYVGLLLFYGNSFLVKEQGAFRPPTEEEVLAIDLHAHDGIRKPHEDVEVEDPALGRTVLLFSRDRFEALLLERLDAGDRAAYLSYKARMQAGIPDAKTP